MVMDENSEMFNLSAVTLLWEYTSHWKVQRIQVPDGPFFAEDVVEAT